MHDAAASVAGGSLRAMDAILRGEVLHAFHPGGGLHHAMPSRAGGFCIYNDVALAIARARAAGLRVMYIDLDVHHGDGVEAIHAADPGVLTVSIHESGRYLFPGTGFAWDDRRGRGGRGRSSTSRSSRGRATRAWSTSVEIAAAGAGRGVRARHHRQPARLRHATPPTRWRTSTVSTTSMGAAARLVDELAHRVRRRPLARDGRRRLRRLRRRAARVGARLAGRRPSRRARCDPARRGASDGRPRPHATESPTCRTGSMTTRSAGRGRKETTSRATRSRLSVSCWCRASSVSRSTSGHGRPSSAGGRTRTAAAPASMSRPPSRRRSSTRPGRRPSSA